MEQLTIHLSEQKVTVSVYLSEEEASILLVILITVRVRIIELPHFILPELLKQRIE